MPTTDHVWRTLSGGQAYGPLVGTAREVVDKARAFHWPLEFPDVLAAGGFDAVIGNPPGMSCSLLKRSSLPSAYRK